MLSSNHNIIIVNFLNNIAIELLKIIRNQSQISSKLLRSIVTENNKTKLMSKSTYYRYVDLLVKNGVVNKSKYREKPGGYTYFISDKGNIFLQSLNQSEISYYNKLCHDLAD